MFLKDEKTEHLKAEAKSLHDLIYHVDCYGANDLLRYETILGELEARGVEFYTELQFNDTLN
jgi:hypothetical protein